MLPRRSADAAILLAAARCIAEATGRAADASADADGAAVPDCRPCSLAQAREAVCQVVTNALDITGQPGDLGPLSHCCAIGADRPV